MRASHLLSAFLVSALHLRAAETLNTAGDAKSPMPPALKVIIFLSTQYFLVYCTLQILQANSQLRGGGKQGVWERIFGEAATTVDFAPMLGVLFLAVRMRAQQLAPPDGMVPTWAQTWMWLTNYGVLLATIAAILEPWLTGSVRQSPDEKRDPLAEEPRRAGQGQFVIAGILSVVKIIATFFVYVGFTTVIFAIFELPAPPGSQVCETCTWQYSPPVSPAVQCVINLAVQYFGVYGLLQVCKVFSTLFSKGRRTPSIRALMSALPSLKLCPMLGILFIGARMRALQMNLEAPPAWAQLAFYTATYASLVQTLCAVLTPMLTGELNNEEDEDGNVISTGGGGSSGIATLLTIVRYLALIMIVLATVVSGYSVFAMKASYGETPAVSTTIRCVLNLTAQFFVITLLHTMVQSYSSLMSRGYKSDFQLVLQAALPTLSFIPMLCVLFVGIRMRALQLDPEGAPQTWVQDAMVMTTYAVLVQTVCALLMPFFSGALGGWYIVSPELQRLIVGVKFLGLGATVFGIGTAIVGVNAL